MHLEALAGDGLALSSAPLPLAGPGSSCTVRLRCLAGASGLHLVVREDEAVRLRAEVPAEAGEAVLVQLELDPQGGLHAWSPGRHVLSLPPDERFGPAPPIWPAGEGSPLDLALLVDGTLRAAGPRGPLLARRELWEPHVEWLVDLVSALSPESDARVAVLAFGDDPTPYATAAELLPDYRLHPAEPALAPLAPDQVLGELLALPPTSGGDFVDALADGLAACRGLHWRPDAQKLLVLTGDSPGHSLLHPVRKGGDAQVRELDVDTQALALQAVGVEVMTIYHEPPAGSGVGEFDFQRDLLEHARAQYRRLASRPELAFLAGRFDPQAAAERVRRAPGPVGRGAAWGELLAVLPVAGAVPPGV